MTKLRNRNLCRFGLAFAVLCLCASLAGCGATQSAQQPLATSLNEIVPHHDRDHFVYLVERPGMQGIKDGALQVEHVTKLESAGEFEVTLSEDGMATGRVHIRDDGKTLWLLSEDDYAQGVRMLYDPPLPYLTVPLFAGETRASANVTMRQLADGQSAGRIQVTQVTQASAAPAGQWLSGSYARGVQLQTERTLLSAEGNMSLRSTTVLVPGIGDVKSEGQINGAVNTRRSLACAIIAQRTIGDCQSFFRRRLQR